MRRGVAVALMSVAAAAALSAPAFADQEPDDAQAPHVPAPLSNLPARAWVVMLERSGRVIAASEDGEELPIASTTKLMTAYVTLEREALDKMVVEQPYVQSTAVE